MKGAATITATYIAHGAKFRVLIRPANAKRLTRVVDTEQDAIDLVRHFNRLGLAGVDLGSALAEARTESAKTYAPLREALPTFLAEQVTLGNLRASSARVYRSRLERWAYPELGAIPWNLITREDVGAAILAARRAGKSRAVIEGIRGPLTKFYQWQMHAHRWPGPNPAAELSFFVGKGLEGHAPAGPPVVSPRGGAATPRGLPGALPPLGRLPRRLVRVRHALGGDDGARAGGHRLGARPPPRLAHLVRARQPHRGLQGRRGALDQGAEPGGPAGPPRPRGRGPPRGPGEGLAARSTPACLPQLGRPGHPVRDLPKRCLAAAPDPRRAPLPKAPRDAA